MPDNPTVDCEFVAARLETELPVLGGITPSVGLTKAFASELEA